MAASFLLRLQRGSGNRYVQDVISRARSGSAESPARGRRPQPAGLDVGGMVSAALQQAIARARHGGRRLDPGTAAELGGALGRDVSQVRVHDDGQADRLSRSLDAAAFTVGSDIFFRARHYDPGTTPGRRLLAHELAHAVQQHAGPRSAYRYRLASAGDPGERAADRAAEDIIGRGRAQPAAVPPVVPLIQRKAFIGRNPMSARPAEFGDPPLRTPGSLEEGADSPRARRQADDLPPLKRPKREVIPPEDSDLGLGDRNLAVVLKDNRSRYFRTRSELYRFAGGQTDDIGYVDREKVWARLPDDFLVLGENHARTTVMDLVEATSIKKYVYEGSEARPSPYLYPRKRTDEKEHQLEESLPKFVVGLIGVQRKLAASLQRFKRREAGWEKEIREDRLTADRTDPEAERRRYVAELAQWSSDWEARYQSRDERGERVTVSGGKYVGQHKPIGGLSDPAPNRPYDRGQAEVKATLQVLQALKAMGTTRGKKDPVVSFYTTNQSAIDKTIKQLKSGLPVEVTRMFIKMVAGEFDLQVLIDRLSAAAVQERADLNVTSAQTYHSYAPGTFLNPAEAQAEELRDSYMLHRIIEAKADGYRLAGLGDLHRQRLQRVLEEMIPGIIVVSSDDFYLGQFRLHPDRD